MSDNQPTTLACLRPLGPGVIRTVATSSDGTLQWARLCPQHDTAGTRRIVENEYQVGLKTGWVIESFEHERYKCVECGEKWNALRRQAKLYQVAAEATQRPHPPKIGGGRANMGLKVHGDTAERLIAVQDPCHKVIDASGRVIWGGLCETHRKDPDHWKPMREQVKAWAGRHGTWTWEKSPPGTADLCVVCEGHQETFRLKQEKACELFKRAPTERFGSTPLCDEVVAWTYARSDGKTEPYLASVLCSTHSDSETRYHLRKELGGKGGYSNQATPDWVTWPADHERLHGGTRCRVCTGAFKPPSKNILKDRVADQPDQQHEATPTGTPTNNNQKDSDMSNNTYNTDAQSTAAEVIRERRQKQLKKLVDKELPAVLKMVEKASDGTVIRVDRGEGLFDIFLRSGRKWHQMYVDGRNTNDQMAAKLLGYFENADITVLSEKPGK